MKKFALFCLAAVFALSACSVSVSDFLEENVKGRPNVLGITVEAVPINWLIETKDGKYFVNVETPTTIRVTIDNPRNARFLITVLDNGAPVDANDIKREQTGTNEITLTMGPREQIYNLSLQLRTSDASQSFVEHKLPVIIGRNFYEIKNITTGTGTLIVSFPELKNAPAINNGENLYVPEGVKVSFTAKPNPDQVADPQGFLITTGSAFISIGGYTANGGSGGNAWARRSLFTMVDDDIDVAVGFISFTSNNLNNLITFSAAGDTIYLNRDCTVASPISSDKKITIIAEHPVTFTRGSSYYNTFFSVNSGGDLTLKTQENVEFKLDGGNVSGTTTPLISVSDGGKLTLSGDITLENNDNTITGLGGAVALTGPAISYFTMYKGVKITNNTANLGGGVFVRNGKFIMYDGTITGNTALTTPNGGADVYVDSGGTFEQRGGTVGEVYRVP